MRTFCAFCLYFARYSDECARVHACGVKEKYYTKNSTATHDGSSRGQPKQLFPRACRQTQGPRFHILAQDFFIRDAMHGTEKEGPRAPRSMFHARLFYLTKALGVDSLVVQNSILRGQGGGDAFMITHITSYDRTFYKPQCSSGGRGGAGVGRGGWGRGNPLTLVIIMTGRT